MGIQITESIWLNTTESCTLEQLLEASGLTRTDLQDLIDLGAIEPTNQDPDHYLFRADCIVIARTARRLRDDFELNAAGLALALNLLQRIDELEEEINRAPLKRWR